jgi:predicted nucleic acid-binding protein
MTPQPRAFIDASIFIGAFWKKSKQAANVLAKGLKGEYGELFTSTLVIGRMIEYGLDEKVRDLDHARTTVQNIYKVDIIPVGEEPLDFAKTCVDSYPALKLSMTDWVSVYLLKDNQIGTLLSLNKRFDLVHTVNGISKYSDFERKGR